ncbi:MAG: nucleoside triphosphate pyrophosphohydrolase [Oscillospiraceae bacterium]
MDFKVKDSYNIDDLLNIMKLLRSENGCPWDREQTHESIRKNFIEETYEVCEAIDESNPEHLKEELGEVLLQIVFHSQMEDEKSTFSFSDVINDICLKLIIRHPHVFSDTIVASVDDVLSNWADIKQQTKGQTTAAQTLLSVPKQLPALMRADKVQGRAKKANKEFGYTSTSTVLGDLKSEVCELEIAINNNDVQNISEEIGDILFSAVNVARYYNMDAEELLTVSCNKFIKRFSQSEKLAQEKNIDFKTADFNCLDALWKEVKKSMN